MSLEKHLETENFFSSSFLYLDCYFREMLNNWQFTKKEGLDIELVLHVQNGESVDHLFLHCLVAMDLWSMVFGMFGMSWAMRQSVVGF